MYKYFKNIICNIKNIGIKLYIIVPIITYSIITIASMDNYHLMEDPVRILGGFPLNQFPFSVYTMVWILPKILLSYLLFIYIGNLVNTNLYLSITRIRSKVEWYIIYNSIGLVLIFIWYIVGYVTINLILYISFGEIYLGIIKNITMIILDILFTYFIFNVVYLLGIIIKKLNLGIILSLILYFSPIFTNNPNRLLFKLLPSNHAMILRQDYLSYSYSYICILSITLLLIGCYLFRKTEL